MLLLSFADIFSKKHFFFKNILSGTLSECQTVWIQIRPDFLAKVISRRQKLLSLLSAIFFLNEIFQNILSRTLSECQTDILSVLI